MNDSQAQRANRRAAVEETVRDFWTSRPRRPHAGRKGAGVAAGVAERYAVDPTLVRVAFVVATVFGGAGVLVYLLGWLLLPKEGERASAFESLIGRGASSVSAAFTVLLCLALIPATSAMLGSSSPFGGPFSGPVGFAGLLAGLYLLHRSRAALGVVSAGANDPGAGFGEGSRMFTQTQQGVSPQGAAPGWDPLGAAPFAWDLPEPSPPPQPPRAPRRRPRNGLVGLATALVTLAVCLLVAPLTGGWMTPPHVVGIVLGALGLSMVSAAFRGGAKGLVPLAVILAAAGLVGTAAGVPGDPAGFGDTHYRPAAANQVRPSYDNRFGSMNLDLRGLPASGPAVHTAVTSKFGDARVTVPRNADVTVRCDTSFGHVDCLGKQVGGGSSELSRTVDLGPDGRGGPAIDLTATSKFGNLEVTRG